jgi:tellurite resistance protein TerA
MAIDYIKRPSTRPSPSAPAKVTLTKAAPKISLDKQAGQLRINLNWDARPAAPGGKPLGLLKRLAPGGGAIDLDLGCLWELTDGTKGVVQALGNAFGQLDRAPFIALSGDDRSGANSGGEDMFINLAHAGQIKRVLVFACIYEGVASFDQANGVVTLSPASGPAIEVRLDEQAGGSRMCAIALIEGGSTGLTIRREVQYVQGTQSALDQAYGWGMNWARGRK